jgi:hypothetical protein
LKALGKYDIIIIIKKGLLRGCHSNQYSFQYS